MQTAVPSRTALRVALRRAAHQLYDAKPLVLDDSVAVPILGKGYLEELRRTPIHPNRLASMALRAFLVARSRYAEELLARAVSEGVEQYVLLGAGLDTFAHRNRHAGLRVFEVDHPATQQWKRELIASSGLAEPPRLTYVPVDFETQALTEELARAGFDRGRPAMFAWLGVVPYLTAEAFRATLAYIAACGRGSGVVMDYGQPRSVLPHFEQLAHDSLSARVKLAGEPFQLFFTPREMAGELKEFWNVEDMGADEINARYFAERSDRLRVMGSAVRFVSAWV